MRPRPSGSRRANPPRGATPPSSASRPTTLPTQALTSFDPEVFAQPDSEMLQDRLFRIQQVQLELNDREIRRQSRLSLTRMAEPKHGDRDVTHVVRTTSKILLSKLELLLEERLRLAPSFSADVEESIVHCRVRLAVTYWRIFRINDLPPEILANIFRLIAWSATTVANRVKTRLALTWVCKHWRSVAVSDPTIWNAIWIWNDPTFEHALTWLDRAGAAPLDVRILETGNHESRKFTSDGMSTLLDKLFVKLSQIRVFVVVVERWPPALVVLDKLREFGVEGMTMTLERFELHRSGNTYLQLGPGYQPDAHRFPFTLFGSASSPFFTYLCLNGVHIDWSIPRLSNLTTLDLRRLPLEVSPNFTRFRHLLQCSPNLFKLTLDGAGPSVQPTLDLGLNPVPLPRLRILVLGDFSLNYGLYIFAQIDTSCVRDLTLSNMTGEDYVPLVAAMISRSTNVQILTMYSFEVEDSASSRRIFIKWLDSMPDLAYLKVARLKPHVLNMFSGDRDGNVSRISNISPLLPKMTAMEYDNMHSEVIVGFIGSRMRFSTPIRKLYIHERCISSVSKRDEETLRRVTNLFVIPAGGTSPDENLIFRSFSS